MKNNTVKNVWIIIGSILFALILLEVGLRSFYRTGWKNLILLQGGNLVEHHFQGLFIYDETLGWKPNPNAAKIKDGTPYIIDQNGFRSNGNNAIHRDDYLVIAVGDSFTFGDGVNDQQTWPSLLEAASGVRVINAGVSSYGVDQIIVKAQRLARQYQPDLIFVSFVPEALQRISQVVRHGVPKPYFDIENNQLALKNVPVPVKEDVRLDSFRAMFGYSHLMHQIMMRLNPGYWWQDTMFDIRYVQIDDGRVMNMLFDSLAKSVEEKTKICILIQAGFNVDPFHLEFIQPLRQHLKSLESENFMVVNLIPELIGLKEADEREFFSLHQMEDPSPHMTVEGNQFVAQHALKVLSLSF